MARPRQSGPKPKGTDPKQNRYFVPTPVRAPEKGEGLEAYRAYLACYEAYVQYLDFSKKKFWSAKQARGLEYASNIVPSGEADPLIQRVSNKTQVLKVPVLDIRVSQDATPIPKSVPKKTGETTLVDPAVKEARKRARRQRRRERKRAAQRLAEVEILKQKTKLVEARKSYANALGTGPKQPVRPKVKGKKAEAVPEKDAKTPLKKGKKPEKKPKGKGSPKPPGPPGPPSGGGTSGGPSAPGDEKSPKDSGPSGPRPPNRKARRRAIYGPPGAGSSSTAEPAAQSPSETGVGLGATAISEPTGFTAEESLADSQRRNVAAALEGRFNPFQSMAAAYPSVPGSETTPGPTMVAALQSLGPVDSGLSEVGRRLADEVRRQHAFRMPPGAEDAAKANLFGRSI